MTRPKQIEFFDHYGEEYRWRLRSANGRILCSPGEGFDRMRGAYRNAITALGIAERSDLVVPDEEHRVMVAEMVAKAWCKQHQDLHAGYGCLNGCMPGQWVQRLNPEDHR